MPLYESVPIYLKSLIRGYFGCLGFGLQWCPWAPRPCPSAYLWLQPHLPWWHVMGAQTHLVLTAPAQASMRMLKEPGSKWERVGYPALRQPSIHGGQNWGINAADSWPWVQWSWAPVPPKHLPHYMWFSFFLPYSLPPASQDHLGRKPTCTQASPALRLWAKVRTLTQCTGHPWMYISAIDLLISSGSIPRIVHCWVKGQGLLKTNSGSALFSRVPRCKSIDCILFACAVPSQSAHEGSLYQLPAACESPSPEAPEVSSCCSLKLMMNGIIRMHIHCRPNRHLTLLLGSY